MKNKSKKLFQFETYLLSFSVLILLYVFTISFFYNENKIFALEHINNIESNLQQITQTSTTSLQSNTNSIVTISDAHFADMQSSPKIIMADNGHIYVTWFAEKGSSSEALACSSCDAIMFSKSNDGGLTFSLPEKLTDTSLLDEYLEEELQIATHKNNVYIVWAGYDEINEKTIMVAVSNDNGDTFTIKSLSSLKIQDEIIGDKIIDQVITANDDIITESQDLVERYDILRIPTENTRSAAMDEMINTTTTTTRATTSNAIATSPLHSIQPIQYLLSSSSSDDVDLTPPWGADEESSDDVDLTPPWGADEESSDDVDLTPPWGADEESSDDVDLTPPWGADEESSDDVDLTPPWGADEEEGLTDDEDDIDLIDEEEKTNESLIGNDGYTKLEENPRIAISENGILYVVWSAKTFPSETSEDLIHSEYVFFTKSIDNGATFEQVTSISNSNKEGVTIGQPRIAVSGSNVYVAWEGTDIDPSSCAITCTGPQKIFLAKSEDRGNNFNKIIGISNNNLETDSYIEQLVASQNNVIILWNKCECMAPGGSRVSASITDLYLSTSNDNGNTFQRAIPLTVNRDKIFDPTLKVSDKNVYVVWQDNTYRYGEILFASNRNQFKSGNLSSDPLPSKSPKLAVWQNNVYLLWTMGSNQAKMLSSTDGGITFSIETILKIASADIDVYKKDIHTNGVIMTWANKNKILFMILDLNK